MATPYSPFNPGPGGGPPPGLGPIAAGDYSNSRRIGDDNERRKQGLQLFFQLRDRKYTSIVNELFRCYAFPDIANGIYRKYKILPYTWEADLNNLKSRNDPRMQWFKPGRMRYLTETTENYPAVDKRLNFPDRGNVDIEKVVDEFIDSEKKHFEKLSVFMTNYVAEVEAIAHEKVGNQAATALGLSRADVDYIFGVNFSRVLQASERFLVTLEVLSLVPAHPNVPGGRPALLADIVILSGKSLVQSYGPYNATYKYAKESLIKATQQLNSKSGGLSRQLSTPVGTMRHLNFQELWHEISQSKFSLRQATIDSVLIRPIQRFPQYMVLFKELLKKADGHPAQPRINQALEAIVQFTKDIDVQVREYQRKQQSYG